MEDRYGWIKEYGTIPTRADNKIEIEKSCRDTNRGEKYGKNLYPKLPVGFHQLSEGSHLHDSSPDEGEFQHLHKTV
jgi:hypothetical protein